MKVSCAILAGGKSKRFGGNKFLALYRGKPLIKYVFDKVKNIFDKIYVVVKEKGPFEAALEGVEFLVDERKDVFSPLVGIETALSGAETPYVFVISGDMPFVSEEPIREILSYVPQGWDAVVPKTEKGLEPLFAVYSRSCLGFVKRALSKGEMKVSSFFPNVRVLFLEPTWDEKVFFNVNTPEDLRKAE